MQKIELQIIDRNHSATKSGQTIILIFSAKTIRRKLPIILLTLFLECFKMVLFQPPILVSAMKQFAVIILYSQITRATGQRNRL